MKHTKTLVTVTIILLTAFGYYGYTLLAKVTPAKAPAQTELACQF